MGTPLRIRAAFAALLFLTGSIASVLATGAAVDDAPRFAEVWAYVSAGDEGLLAQKPPITDAAHFSASINSSGELVGLPDPKRLSAFPGRKHLVVAELGNSALSHFCLSPEFRVRDELIEAIGRAGEGYDGVQIDFEAVLTKDRDAFFAFLRLLKARIGPKILSVAVPARFKTVDEAYEYGAIAAIADRVVVMAYDEHWSTSVPGPIASTQWCRAVAAFATGKIERGKLIMGLPFYGRAWADKQLSRAYRHDGVARLLTEKVDATSGRENDIPFLEYRESVNVKVFYEDAPSIRSKLEAYAAAGVGAVSFWRLGQEDPGVWQVVGFFRP